MWNALVVTPITQGILFFKNLLTGFGVPYSFGFAIILFTLLIKILTLPLNLQQLRASKAMQELQPKLQELQRKYRKNKEKLAQEQMKLYREAGVNPLGGCLPTLIQFPIWIGLYQALFRLAQQGTLSEGFFFIPSLAKPVGLTWLWPPSNWQWPDVAAYLVLPVLTLLTQIIVQKMMSTPSTDTQQEIMNQMMYMFPIMFFFFALQVPSGLALYWVTMNVFTMIQQYIFMGGWGGLSPYKAPVETSRRKGAKDGERDKKRRSQRSHR
ncbi:MAG: hypothetical protein DRI61_04035 [Chloroflexi bacterium]|nr:MAG: hypothetical protein DRI61_04035 [Chloroflexota bacterium]HDN79662.1 YidC/Oxa1 family membrane protein insertase [Chloroflexota bacterium]